MKKLLLFLNIVCASFAFSSDGCVTIKKNGTYIVGDEKKEMPKSAQIIDKGVSGTSVIKSMPSVQFMILR